MFPEALFIKPIRIAVILFAILLGALITWSCAAFGYYVFLLFVGAPVLVLGLFNIPVFSSKVNLLLQQIRWRHILWLLFFASGLVFRIRTTEVIQENPLDPWALYRSGLTGFVGVSVLAWFCVKRRLSIQIFFKGLIGWLIAYAIFGAVSTIWSIYPFWTLYKSLEYFVGVALILASVGIMRTISEFKSLFDWTWLLEGFLLFTVLLGLIFWPAKAVYHGVGLLDIQIRGVLPIVAANGVGHLGALLGIIAIVRFLFAKGPSRRFYLLVFLASIMMLVLSQSRSPLTGFLLALPAVLFAAGRFGPLAFLSFGIPVALSFTHLGDYFWRFFLRGQSIELFMSLSGRVHYWEAALPLIREHPFIGSGAYAAGRFLVSFLFSPTLSSLHGTWLEVLIGVGFIGLLPLIVAVTGTWLALLRTPVNKIDVLAEQLRIEAIGVMTLLSVRSIFSVTFIFHPAITWFLVLGYAHFLRNTYARPGSSQFLPTTRR